MSAKQVVEGQQSVDRCQAIEAILQHVRSVPTDLVQLNEIISFTKANLVNATGSGLSSLKRGREGIFQDFLKAFAPNELYAKMALFMIDAWATNEERALVFAVGDLTNDRMGGERFGSGLRQLLDQVSMGVILERQTLLDIRDAIIGARPTISQLIAACTLTGLSPGTSDAMRTAVFEEVVMPIFQMVVGASSSDAVLMLERMIYNQYIKVKEFADHHKKSFERIEPLIRIAGQRDARARPPMPVQAGKEKVCFILHNGARLAHVETLLLLLEAMARLKDCPIEPSVYLLWGYNYAEIRDICARLNIATYVDSGHPDDQSIVGRFDRCRSTLASAGISAAVVVSVPLHLAYLMEAPIAPVQIWWAMKFTLPNFAGLDGRVQNVWVVNRRYEVDGVSWRGSPPGFPWPEIPSEEAVSQIKSKFGQRKIIGTVAREEKIREPSFLSAVVRMLKRHQDAVFVWTGRTRLPEIEAAFSRGGVADRCHFVGWVDPAVYCRVFDIFLETFPLTGLMVIWAMYLGTPVVSIGRSGILGAVWDTVFEGTVPIDEADRHEFEDIFALVRGRLPALVADTPADLDMIIDPLLADDRLAADLGRAQNRFILRYTIDALEYARAQSQNFVDIINESRGPAKPSDFAANMA